MLVNVNEEIVRQRMESILKAYDCCKCEKCVNDMMALALNSTKPAYVNTDEGVLFKRINSTLPQTTTDIDIAVVKAVEMVSGNPKHPPLPLEPEPAPVPETPSPVEEKPAPAKKSASAGKRSSAKKAAVPEEDTETEKPAAKKSSAGKKAATKKTEEAETDKPETSSEAQMELF